MSSRPLKRVSSIWTLIRYQVGPNCRIFESFTLSYLSPALTSDELSFLLTPFDLKRLESYAQNSLDYHVILDLLPTVASLYFEKRLGNEVRLSVIQSSILLGMGLQRKSVEEVEVRGHLIVPSDSDPHTLKTCRRNFSCPFRKRSRYS